MRDKKGQPLVQLPPVEIITVKVQLDEEARVFYDAVEAEARQRVEEYMRTAAVSPHEPLTLQITHNLGSIGSHRNECAQYADEAEANRIGPLTSPQQLP